MKISPAALFPEGLMRLICLTIVAFGATLLLSGEYLAQISNPGKNPLPDDSFKSGAAKKQNAESELPLSRVNEFIKPDPDKTIRLPKLSEQEKLSSSVEKKLRIGAVRRLEQKVSDFSQAADFAVAGGTVWVFEIVSEAAIQTRLRFNRMNLPEGGKVFVYSAKNPGEVYGPYEKSGDSKDGNFWTPPVEGDDVIVEYYAPNQPVAAKNGLPFEIGEISHIYRDLSGNQDGERIGPPEYPCHNNVPAGWANVAKSVGRVQFTSGGGEFLCTGTLLNPTANDFDPIFLTANHCISTEAEAQSLRIYWLYDSGDFPTASLPRSDRATLLRTGTSTDYTLLKIRGAIPLRAGVTYSGWEAANTLVGTPVAGIHHPRGSSKRFSTGTTNSTGNYIEVRWNSGITEGGSSGSGIWKGSSDNARLIGTLSYGTDGCTNARDYYGNFTVTYQSISSFLQGGTDDDYDAGAGNDTHQTGVNLGQGSFSNLILKWQDSDWYSVTVPAGFKITATTNFVNSFGNVDLALYKNDADAAPVAVSNTSSNSETVTDTTTGSTTYYLNAYLFDGARNDYSLNITLQQATIVNRQRFDYDGDGRADLSVFRPSNNVWYIQNSSNNSFNSQGFGLTGDLIAPADFDGDGRTDIAVFRPSNGTWYWMNSSNNTLSAVGFGATGDVPVPGDFDGDEKADVAVFRPSNGTWYRLNSRDYSFTAVQFGTSEDKPVIGDFDGDRKADITVWRPSNGVWYRLNSSNNSFFAVQFGSSGDKLIPADYDGDGKTDVSVFRPSNGVWYRLNSSDNSFAGVGFGVSEDVPVAADYDGDFKADIAVFRPSNGNWYILRSQSGFTAQQFGAGVDVPTPATFLR